MLKYEYKGAFATALILIILVIFSSLIIPIIKPIWSSLMILNTGVFNYGG